MARFGVVLQRFGSGRLKFDSVWLCFWFSLPQVGSALLRRVPSMIELGPAWFRFLRAQSSLVQVSHGLLEVARVWPSWIRMWFRSALAWFSLVQVMAC